jgi:arylsulfatase A-like enzyme
MYPHKTGVIGNFGMAGSSELRSRYLTIGRFFQERGYATGYFGKWHLGKTALAEYGFEDSHSGQNDPKTVEHSLQFLDRQHAGGQQPWLCMVSINNPHDIYKVNHYRNEGGLLDLSAIALPDNIADDLADKPEPQRIFRDDDQGKSLKAYSDDDWKYYRGFYNRLVQIVDSQVGQIVNKLEQIGQLEQTIVVLTADHGDLLGAHRTPYKGPMMYDELVKIPLIFRLPGAAVSNQRREQLVINADHFPTLCELAGFEVPEGLDGKSLKEAIASSDAAGREQLVLQYYAKQQWICPIRTILTREWKYSIYWNGEEELYRLSEDLGEQYNLAGASAQRDQKIVMRANLLHWIETNDDPFFTYSATDRLGNPIEPAN